MLNRFNKLIADDATTSEAGAVFKVYNRSSSGFIALDRKLVEGDDGLVLLADIVIGDKRGGGAENGLAHLASKTKGGILRVLILVVSRLVGFVDNNEP